MEGPTGTGSDVAGESLRRRVARGYVRPVAISDSFSLRQKPSGLLKWILKVPGWMFRAKLGFLFGDRFLLISHVGRKSGNTHHTPLEVVVHDRESGEYVVCSGTGPQSDWFLNISQHPVTAVQVGNTTWTPEQRILTSEEAARRFEEYERAHPKTAVRLLRSMGRSYDGTDADRVRMMAEIPMVSFTEPDRTPA